MIDDIILKTPSKQFYLKLHKTCFEHGNGFQYRSEITTSSLYLLFLVILTETTAVNTNFHFQNPSFLSSVLENRLIDNQGIFWPFPRARLPLIIKHARRSLGLLVGTFIKLLFLWYRLGNGRAECPFDLRPLKTALTWSRRGTPWSYGGIW